MIDLPENYTPSEHEEYMCEVQKEYFRRKLLNWKESLLKESTRTMESLKENSLNEPDATDSANNEQIASFEIRTKTRYKKLISKIEAALKRVETEEFGYCEETGDEIGIKRLEARPVATLTIEAQERHERRERQYFDDE